MHAIKVKNIALIAILVIFSPHCRQGTQHWLLQLPQIEETGEITKGPYLLNAAPTSITLMWESSSKNTGRLFYGRDKNSLREVIEDSSRRLHRIALQGLDAESEYFYKVSSGSAVSPLYRFKTAVRQQSPFSFVAFGDSRNGFHTFNKLSRLIAGKKPDFVAHVGDFVERGKTYDQWQKYFFAPAMPFLPTFPFFPIIGNHEDHSDFYFQFFDLPDKKAYYSFDYGNAHFIAIDNVIDIKEDDEQWRWLVKDLSQNRAEWTFVLQHAPLFTAGGYYYDNSRITLKQLCHPLFERYGVDMVICGDDHDYERSVPIVTRDGKKPVTYIVAGNGGVPMRWIGKRSWTKSTHLAYGIVFIRLHGPRMQFQSIDENNRVIDSFALDKSQPASIVEYEKDKIYFEDIVDPITTANLYSEGKKANRNKEYLKAVGLLSEGLAADSTCAECLGLMAASYVKLGETDKALHYAQKALDFLPFHQDSYTAIIQAYSAGGQYQQALAWCEKQAVMRPDIPHAFNNMAQVHRLLGDQAAAIIDLKNALHVLPSDPGIYKNLAEIYESQGNSESARLCYEKALYWTFDAKEAKKIQDELDRLAR